MTFGWDAMVSQHPLGVISSLGMLQNRCIPPKIRAITYYCNIANRAI